VRPEVQAFCDRLRLQFAAVEGVDLGVLSQKSAPYRCDALFEVGVDLSDTLSLYEGGLVNETVVREAAVTVAVEALKVWIVTCRRGTR
jgi:hypothetical protein